MQRQFNDAVVLKFAQCKNFTCSSNTNPEDSGLENNHNNINSHIILTKLLLFDDSCLKLHWLRIDLYSSNKNTYKEEYPYRYIETTVVNVVFT